MTGASNTPRGQQLAEAVASGRRDRVEALLDQCGADMDKAGEDGTTPLCAAALWGDHAMTALLLSRGADPNARNRGTRWTPLHAAAFQEHGKVVMALLEGGADPCVEDAEGRRPLDFASVAEGVWPFFAVQGHERVRKAELVARGVVRKVTEPAAGSGAQAGTAGAVRHLSRPGSAYVRVEESPFGRAPAPRPMVSRPKLFSRKGSSAGLPGIESCIDPLADEPSPPQAKQRGLAALHL